MQFLDVSFGVPMQHSLDFKGFSSECFFLSMYEPPHDKTNKMTCAPSEDSDHPGHLPNLIRVFCMKKAWVLCYPLGAQRRLIDWADAQADLSLRWAHMPFCWFCHGAAHICFPLLPDQGKYPSADVFCTRL